jgi:hypothetical protein
VNPQAHPDELVCLNVVEQPADLCLVFSSFKSLQIPQKQAASFGVGKRLLQLDVTHKVSVDKYNLVVVGRLSLSLSASTFLCIPYFVFVFVSLP